MTSGKIPPLDRRKNYPKGPDLWEQLSLSQKFSASNLLKFGYELSFIRYTSDCKLAVLRCNGQIVTVIENGEIDTAPDIQTR